MTTTAEKRAELEARGEPWPLCECHGESMSWNQKHSMTAGGHFRCRIEVAQWRSNFRKSRSDQGLCVQCGSAELSTKTMCRTCADKHADIMSQPKQHLDHVFTQIRYRKRQHAAEGYESTGVLRRLLDGQV